MPARHVIAWVASVLALALTICAEATANERARAPIRTLTAPPSAAVSPVRAQRAPQRQTASTASAPQRPRARASTDLGETARQRRASGGTPGNLNSVTLPEARTLRYLTDAENRRVAKLVDGTIQRAWLYQDALKPIAELDADGFVTSRFIYASRSNVPDVMLQGDTTYALISDVRGSVRLVVDAATGEVAQRIDYGPFGEVLSDTNPGFQPFGFAGGLYDPDTGFVRFGARDYDASVGRWLSKDPILWTGNQANLYVYVSNDPINGIDPSGLVNPIKLAVGVVNWGRGLKSFVVGLTTMATGVAAAPILGTIWWSRRLRLRGTPARGRCWRNAARNAAIRGVAHRAHRRNFHQEPGRLTTIGPAH